MIGSTLVKFKGGQQLLRLLGAGISGVGFHMLVM